VSDPFGRGLRRCGLGVALLAAGLLIASAALAADDAVPRDAAILQTIQLVQAADDNEPATREAREPAAARPLAAEEIVQAIKLRAQRELAKRRAKKWALNTVTSWTVANESNPALIKSRSSHPYIEEYFSATSSYKFTPKLTWQLGYSLDALNYDEYTDGSTLTNSLTTKLIYRMNPKWRAEAHYTFDDSDYPYDIGASSQDQKVHLRLRQSFLKKYYHYVGWTWLYKQYKSKAVRNGAGTRLPHHDRKDQRHTGIYEIGGRFGKATSLRLRQEFYFNDSNDPFQDYYDAEDYKVKLSGTHDWTKKWSSSAGFTYELKRYERRNVSARGVAEQDYAKTYEIGTTHKISPEIDLTYTWKYKQQDSNDPAQAYQDITNSLALTAAF